MQLASSLMCPCGCWLVFCLEYASMLKLANYHEVIRFHNSSRQTWLENPWFVDVSSSKKIGFYHYFALFHIANSERDWTYPRAVILFQWKPWRSRQAKMEPSDKWLRFQIEFVSESGIPWFLIPSWFNNPNAANRITEHFLFEKKKSSGRFYFGIYWPIGQRKFHSHSELRMAGAKFWMISAKKSTNLKLLEARSEWQFGECVEGMMCSLKYLVHYVWGWSMGLGMQGHQQQQKHKWTWRTSHWVSRSLTSKSLNAIFRYFSPAMRWMSCYSLPLLFWCQSNHPIASSVFIKLILMGYKLEAGLLEKKASYSCWLASHRQVQKIRVAKKNFLDYPDTQRKLKDNEFVLSIYDRFLVRHRVWFWACCQGGRSGAQWKLLFFSGFAGGVGDWFGLP